MRVSSRQTLALARVLLPFALAVSCALNPQPEPPSSSQGGPPTLSGSTSGTSTGGAATTGTGTGGTGTSGGGGAPGSGGTGGAGGSGGTTGISLNAGHEDGGPTPTADATTDAMAGGDVSEDQSDVGVDVVPAQDAADAGSSGD